MIVNELYKQAVDGDKSAGAELFKKLTDRFQVFAHQEVQNRVK